MAFNEKYVTVTGGGLHDGSSEANAWTLAEAASNYAAGDRMNVKAGTYSGYNVSFATNGTISSPISIRGYKVSIGDLDGARTNQLVDGTDIPLIVSNGTGIFITGQHGLYENLSFRSDDSSRASCFCDASEALWNRCRFVTTTPTNSVGIIRRNSPWSQFNECYFSGSSSSSTLSRESTSYQNCVFSSIGGWQSQEYIWLINCIFKEITGYAVQMTQWGGFAISGCTFYDVSGNAIEVAGTNSSLYGQLLINNNVFHTIGGNAISQYSSGSADFNFFATNNLFYNVTGNQFANDDFGFNRNAISDSTDPFVDAAGGDFSLVSGSNGYNNAAPKPYEVFDVNSNRDIGAIQHQDPSGGGGATVHPLYAN